MEWSKDIQQALAAPFPEDEIEFLPRASANGRALALAHIDARSVMRRLDAVVGSDGWAFDFDVVSPDGKKVKGFLTVLGVTKCDAGEAAAEDEPLKAAVSDSVKRCAVHFGIARYLYYLPQIWVPYDAQKRRFTETPRLAAGAVERALAVCGYEGSGPSWSETRAAPRDTPRPSPRPAPQPAPQPAPAEEPESSGDASVAGADPASKSVVAAVRKMAKEAREAGVLNAEDAAQVEETLSTEGVEVGTCKRIRDWIVSLKPAAPDSPAAAPEPGATAAMTCAGPGCGKPLTKGQHDVSMRAFKKSLCPACQRQQAREA